MASRPLEARTVDGLYVVEQGAIAEAPAGWPGEVVALLVHGTMDRAAGLARVARQLADVGVVRYDRRGYGHSAGLGAAPLDRHVDDLFTVLDGRSAVVLGHSFGGLVALVAAQRAPGQVVAVVAYEAPTPWEPWWPRWDPLTAHRGSHDPPGDAAEAFMRSMIGDDRWQRLPARTRADRRAEGAAMVTEVASAGAQVVDLRAVAVPVVSAHGSRSGERHVRGAEAIASAVPHGELVTVDGAGHGAPITHARELADLVRRVAGGAGGPAARGGPRGPTG